MGIWRLFNGPLAIEYVTEHWYIVDNLGQWPCDKAYGELGLTEGWLTLLRYNQDIWGEQHYFLVQSPLD